LAAGSSSCPWIFAPGDPRARAGGHVEDERRAVGIVLDDRRRGVTTAFR
jgi:hypothetical protein